MQSELPKCTIKHGIRSNKGSNVRKLKHACKRFHISLMEFSNELIVHFLRNTISDPLKHIRPYLDAQLYPTSSLVLIIQVILIVYKHPCYVTSLPLSCAKC